MDTVFVSYLLSSIGAVAGGYLLKLLREKYMKRTEKQYAAGIKHFVAENEKGIAKFAKDIHQAKENTQKAEAERVRIADIQSVLESLNDAAEGPQPIPTPTRVREIRERLNNAARTPISQARSWAGTPRRSVTSVRGGSVRTPIDPKLAEALKKNRRSAPEVKSWFAQAVAAVNDFADNQGSGR